MAEQLMNNPRMFLIWAAVFNSLIQEALLSPEGEQEDNFINSLSFPLLPVIVGVILVILLILIAAIAIWNLMNYCNHNPYVDNERVSFVQPAYTNSYVAYVPPVRGDQMEMRGSGIKGEKKVVQAERDAVYPNITDIAENNVYLNVRL